MNQNTKKIGFVDLYISEWHANNYPVWMREIAKTLGYDYEIAYAYAEEDVSPVDGRTTAEWCEQFGVTACATIGELCEKSDCIVILAPSNPEAHLRLAAAVLPYKKRTYIDKTFAPDAATAREIFRIAEQYGTPFFSTSALRFSEELDLVKDPTLGVTTGSGRSADEYIVHQAEMVVKKLGIGADAVRATDLGNALCFHVRYGDGRSAQMTYSKGSLPFTVYLAGDAGTKYSSVKSDFFKILMKEILVFFETGDLPFDPVETDEVMRIREAALRAAETPDVWVALP